MFLFCGYCVWIEKIHIVGLQNNGKGFERTKSWLIRGHILVFTQRDRQKERSNSLRMCVVPAKIQGTSRALPLHHRNRYEFPYYIIVSQSSHRVKEEVVPVHN